MKEKKNEEEEEDQEEGDNEQVVTRDIPAKEVKIPTFNTGNLKPLSWSKTVSLDFQHISLVYSNRPSVISG